MDEINQIFTNPVNQMSPLVRNFGHIYNFVAFFYYLFIFLVHHYCRSSFVTTVVLSLFNCIEARNWILNRCLGIGQAEIKEFIRICLKK